MINPSLREKRIMPNNGLKKRGKKKKNTFFVCFSKCSFCVLLLLVFFFLPLGLISFLHVRTGLSRSQVKLVTRVLPLLLPHLHLPFSSPALRRTSPSIWHNEQEWEKLPERCTEVCAGDTLRKTIPALLRQSSVRNNFVFQRTYSDPVPK